MKAAVKKVIGTVRGESNKAIYVKFSHHNPIENCPDVHKEWVAKSQVSIINDNEIVIPEWLFLTIQKRIIAGFNNYYNNGKNHINENDCYLYEI